MFDKFHEECGVFGVYGHPEAANLTYLGLYAQQHRGQESAGIVTSDTRKHCVVTGMGHVTRVFNEKNIKSLQGHIAIGHNRYSTTGESSARNIQPLTLEYVHGPLALAHNGNLIDTDRLRAELEAGGAIFQSTVDSEVVVHLIAQSREDTFCGRAVEALKRVNGAYSLLLMTRDELVAVRDPYGFRPLAMGKKGTATVFASETCAFDIIEAEYVRDVAPGEMISVTAGGQIKSFFPFEKKPTHQCIFEYIYFSRPDSRIYGHSVYEIRREFGRLLARMSPADADIVVPVPDSGVPAAIGYAQESGIPFELGLIRSHYVGRTFIEPEQSIRHFGVKIKLNGVQSLLRGKRVIVVDDSIVRGTTSRKIVKMIRSFGAKEVHMRISSPPTRHSCFYGIDTPRREELIAANNSIEDIAKYLEVDSLGYLDHDKMLESMGTEKNLFCSACFNGQYPVTVPREIPQLGLFDQ